MLDALSDAADEITRELARGSVELRLRGGGPDFVVKPPPADEPLESAHGAARPPEIDEGEMTRINLRLPEPLKAAIEQAAGSERLSVNGWLVRAAAAALANDDRDRSARPRGGRIGQGYTGWVR